MNLETKLDDIHATVVKNPWLQIFTAFTRVVLALGFIPPSIPKIMNVPFTVLPDSNPVGHYFNALYQTGFYYQFIGWGQIIAAFFLLFPRTAHLGALMFFPIILNITVLTNSVGFAGTQYITLLMLFACAYLVAWDYDRLKPILFFQRTTNARLIKMEFIWLPILFAAGGSATAFLAAALGVGGERQSYFPILAILSAGGFIFGLICAVHHKYMKI